MERTDGMQELSELAGRGPRREILRLASGDVPVMPLTLNDLIEQAQSEFASDLHQTLDTLWRAARRAGYTGTREELASSIDALDLEECERVMIALFPPPKADPVAEAVGRAVGVASSG
ncbi:MAG: hypothetical protein GYA36_22980 [Veillonellaceae bacterium]|nr:hypothetical protein [Veillonellaceae bacterium]